MSDDDIDIPDQLTLEDMIPGIDSFVTQIEGEIKTHHAHQEWIDLDKQCVEEVNLILRVGIIMGMLDKVLVQFQLPETHDLAIRIQHAKNYFTKANYL
ncbi:MAG: hypothetical protein P8P98_02760 [Emcibacteraceae bacterium]|nr:hypothetical protein [Emcibacteraceae bacterium]MDG1996939.1 hypothetical protein [Emcibacteraceae bacterium]